jgi:hypothetical protein
MSFKLILETLLLLWTMSLSHWDKIKYDQYENDKPDRNHALAEGGRKVTVDNPKPEVKPHNEWTPYAGPVMWTGMLSRK